VEDYKVYAASLSLVTEMEYSRTSPLSENSCPRVKLEYRDLTQAGNRHR
jgi:hypothetical protein